MPFVVSMVDKVVCGHGGTVTPSSTAKLSVAGAKVCTRTSVETKPVSGCATPVIAATPTTPPSVPCVTCTKLGPGVEATKLKVAGVPVLFHPLSGQTDGTVSGTTPQLLLKSTPGQAKLTSI